MPENTYLPGLSVVTSLYNEAKNVRELLENIRWADEIVVVDGSSPDGTAALAREYTDRVIVTDNKLMLNINKQLGFDNARHEWVLLLDGDERLTDELADEIRAIVRSNDAEHAGYWLPRKTFVMGHWMQFGGCYPDYQLRLFRNGRGRFPCVDTHEMIAVDGSTGHLRGDMLHYTDDSVASLVAKRNFYSEYLAQRLYKEGKRFPRWYMFAEPLWLFFQGFALRGGFRDGTVGFISATIGMFGRFMLHAKLWDAYRRGVMPGSVVPPRAPLESRGDGPGDEQRCQGVAGRSGQDGGLAGGVFSRPGRKGAT